MNSQIHRESKKDRTLLGKNNNKKVNQIKTVK